MINFCDSNRLKNLINVPACDLNFDNSTRTDFIMTGHPCYLQHRTVFEKGLSDQGLFISVME